MAQSSIVSLLLKTAKVTAILLIFAYIFLKLWRNLDQLKEAELSLNVPLLAASFPFAVAYLVGRAMIWHLIVRRLIQPFPLHMDMLSWMSSIVGKYIPGKVFLLLGRVHFYRGSGASAAHVSLSFLIESCASCLAGSVIFGLALILDKAEVLASYAATVAIAVVVLLVVTHPKVLGAIINAGLRAARQPPATLQLRWSDVGTWTLLMVANWLVLGTGFFLLLCSLIDLPVGRLPYVTGSFALAGVIGILVLFAPSGIGVREGIMAAALSRILPTGIAVIAALLARVWMTLAEVLCAGLAMVLIRLLGWQGRLGVSERGVESAVEATTPKATAPDR